MEAVEDLPGLQILMVDDITPNRDLGRLILEHGQPEVKDARKGLRGLEISTEKKSYFEAVLH